MAKCVKKKLELVLQSHWTKGERIAINWPDSRSEKTPQNLKKSTLVYYSVTLHSISAPRNL